MSLPYLDRLDSERQAVFHKLKPFADRFVLVGGTAIMLQIGHRLSYDFDLFSSDPLQPQLLRKIRRLFPGTTVAINTSELLLTKTGSGVDMHFAYYPYPHLQKPVHTGALPVARLDDLAANKAYTIGRRGTWRDYVDLFFLMKWQIYTLDAIIHLAEKKFEDEFNDKLFLQQLTYFADLRIGKTVFLKESYTAGEIKSFLSGQTDQYVQKALGLQ